MANDPTLRREGDHMVVIDPVRVIIANRDKLIKEVSKRIRLEIAMKER